MKKLDRFIERMNTIGINMKLVGNAPWIYIDKINGKRVTEKFKAKHGFTLCYYPRNKDDVIEFTDITEIFNLIRKYR